MAATRCADPPEIDEFRTATRAALLEFSRANVYVDRPALAVLALIDGASRFHDVRVSIP